MAGRVRKKRTVCPLCLQVRSLTAVGGRPCWGHVGGLVVCGECVQGELRPAPLQPTTHLPGTAGKLDVMRLRHERGERLYHPLDAGTDQLRLPAWLIRLLER